MTKEEVELKEDEKIEEEEEKVEENDCKETLLYFRPWCLWLFRQKVLLLVSNSSTAVVIVTLFDQNVTVCVEFQYPCCRSIDRMVCLLKNLCLDNYVKFSLFMSKRKMRILTNNL